MSRRSNSNGRKRYTASERRAYWIGMGAKMFGEYGDAKDSAKLQDAFTSSLGKAEADSFINGLLGLGKPKFSRYKNK